MITKLLLLIIGFCLIVGCRCDTYYSNSDGKTLNGKFLNLDCKINEDDDLLEINLSYNKYPAIKIVPNTVKVTALINNLDTLPLNSQYAEMYYTFRNQKSKIRDSKLELIINYTIDSMSQKVRKKVLYTNLKVIKECRFRAALH